MCASTIIIKIRLFRKLHRKPPCVSCASSRLREQYSIFWFERNFLMELLDSIEFNSSRQKFVGTVSQRWYIYKSPRMIDSDDHESQQDGALLASSSLPWYKYHQRILLAAASSIAIVLVVFFLTALFASVNVHGSASSDNSIVSPGSIVHLSASTVDSWNGWVCSTYSWDLSGPTSTRQLKGKDVAYNVTSSDSFTTATVSCKNSFGTSLGTSSKVSWYVGIAKDTAVQVTDPSEIVQCPTQNKVDPTTGELKVSTTSSLANLDADTALYSSECNGFVVKLLQPPNASTGIAPYTLNTSLEDIFYSLSAPPISIPYTAVNVDENSSSSSSSKATRKLSAFKLVNEQNWNLPYSSQFISGSALFNELVWSVDTTLQSLEYADGSFKGVTWHASTSITIDVVFTAVISTGSVDAKITLVNVNTPPVVLPVPGLEFITVNTDFSVDLKLTGYSSVVGGSVTAKWSAKCQLDYEWQVTCMNTLTCTGEVLQDSFTMSTPSGSVTFSDDNSESSTLTAALLIGVGLQMDEAVAINDEASIILAFTATEQYSDCPALTVQVVDAVTVNLRFFSISISPELYSFPVYAGQPVGIATDQTCAPTAAPTASVYPHYSFIFLDTSTSCTDCYDIWGQYLCPDGLWCYQPCTAECTPDDDYYAQQRTPHSWVQIPGGSTVYINGIGEYWYNMALYGACWSQYSPYDCVLYFAMDEAFTYGPGYEVETVTNNVLTTAASCNTDVYPGFSHCWQKSYYPAITDDAYYEYIPPTPWPPAESQSTSSPGKLLRGPVI